MIRILILEDNNEKATRIIREILSVGTIREENIITVIDVIQAKKELLINSFDLLILDIQIPNRFGQQPNKEGGIKFLEELSESKKYSVPSHIIGLTAYSDVYENSNTKFDMLAMKLLFYDESSLNWVEQLNNKIKYIVNSSLTLRKNLYTDYQTDFAIICALDQPELEDFIKLSNDTKPISLPNDNTRYYSCLFKNQKKEARVILSSSCEMGMSASAILATKIIYNFRPKFLFMGGILAGVKGKVNLGDIILADPSYDYGSGKYFGPDDQMQFLPEPRQLRIDPEILSKIKNYLSDTDILSRISTKWTGNKPGDLRFHVGPVGSGASVLANIKYVEALISHNRKLVGIEMETYAVYLASINSVSPRPLFASIKSVCDFADDLKNDEFQKYAAYTSASFLVNFILDCL